MTDIKAADLPEGSVVADARIAWIKNQPRDRAQWSGTDGSFTPDSEIDNRLSGRLGAGAVVLREGR